jgi:putative membrane protein
MMTTGIAGLLDAQGIDHMNGFGWGMMGIGWVMGLILIGVLVWAVVQATSRSNESGAPTSAGSAEAILADRFARGEIDDDEYRRRLDTLRA